MTKFSSVIALFGVLGLSNCQLAPTIVLYGGVHQTGESRSFGTTYVPNLAARGFDNKIQSVCATGTWLFYDKPNYNEGYNNAGMEWIFGPALSYCADLRTNRGSVSSLRYVGSPSDYTKDSITLFAGTYFQGQEEFFLESAKGLVLNGLVKSLIITGTSGWTVYDQEDYRGNGVCVIPKASTNFTPEFVTDVKAFSIPHGTVKSLRKGCY